MRGMRILLAFTLVLALSAAARAGEATDANLDILRETIRANKKALVAVNLQLSDEEAARFWPVYDRYQNDLRPVSDRFVKVIQDYIARFDDLSDDEALKLLDDYLAVEADRVKVRREYRPEFSKALAGRKVLRFYQIENKMDAVLRFDLAAEIPVVPDETDDAVPTPPAPR